MADDRLARYVIEIGGDASDLDKVFAGIKTSVSSTVADLQRSTSKLDLFADLKNSIPGVERSLQSAKDAVTRFAAEMAKIEASGGKAPKELTKSLADAEKAVVSTTRELGKQQQKLTELDTALTRSGVNTKNLAAEQQRLAVASKAAADAAALQAAKQTLGLTTLKDTEAQAAKLRQAFDALQKSGTLSAQEIAIAQQRLRQELQQLEGTVTKASVSFKSIGDAKASFTALAGPILAATAALGGLTAELRRAVDAAQAFENNLATIGTVTTLTKKELEALGDGARQLSRDIGIDVNEAVKSLYELLRSGVAPENSLEVLRKSAEAAKAALTDTATGAKAASALLDSFGLDVQQLGPALDIVVKSAQNGGPTLKEFADNAGQLGNAARATGADFREVTALLNVMTSASGNAAESATTLTRILLNLNKPEIGAKLREMGIDGKSLVETFRKLDANGLQLNNFLQLGIESGKGAAGLAALTNNAEKIPAALNNVATATGAVATANEKLFDTQKERFDRFTAALKDLEIQLGKTIGSMGGLLPVLTLVLNLFTDLGRSFDKFDKLTAGPVATILRLANNLLEARAAAEKAKPPIAEFHQGLVEGQTIVIKATENLKKLRGELELYGADLLKQGDAIRAATTGQVAEINKRVELEIAALDKSLKAQEASGLAAVELRKKANAEIVAVIQDGENQIRIATEAAIAQRTALAAKDADSQKKLATDIAVIRQQSLQKTITDYQAHYDNLAKQADGFKNRLNAIESERVAFNEGIQNKLRGVRVAGLSDLAQYAEKAQEVDRLIAKGRETAADQGIEAAKKYFDQAGQIAESIKGEVLSDGTVVVSAFESQQKSLQKIKDVANAYNGELDKAGDKAKAGAATTDDALKTVGDRLKELRKQLDDINKAIGEGIRLSINEDIQGLAEAQRKIAELVKPETKVVTVRTVAPGQEGSPEFVGPPSPGFNRGGEVRRQFAQMYAGGGPVFRPLSGHRVPGVGSGDTHPAALRPGSFVLRKAASQFYGDGAMSRLARGYASGGMVEDLKQAQLAIGYFNAIRPYLLPYSIFRYPVDFMYQRVKLLERDPSDTGTAEALIKDVGSIAANFALYTTSLGKIAGGGGTIFTKPLLSYEEFVRRVSPSSSMRGFASGGPVGSDRVPAWLTPGETVLTPEVTRALGSNFLNAVNQTRVAPAQLSSVLSRFRPPAPRYFNNGGIVPGASVSERGTISSGPAVGEMNIHIHGIGSDFTDPRVQRRAANGIREQLRREGILSSS